jgi:hypothetical protein
MSNRGAGVEKRPGPELVDGRGDLVVAGLVHVITARLEQRGGDVAVILGELHDQKRRRIIPEVARIADGKPRRHVTPEELGHETRVDALDDRQ